MTSIVSVSYKKNGKTKKRRKKLSKGRKKKRMSVLNVSCAMISLLVQHKENMREQAIQSNSVLSFNNNKITFSPFFCQSVLSKAERHDSCNAALSSHHSNLYLLSVHQEKETFLQGVGQFDRFAYKVYILIDASMTSGVGTVASPHFAVRYDHFSAAGR